MVVEVVVERNASATGTRDGIELKEQGQEHGQGLILAPAPAFGDNDLLIRRLRTAANAPLDCVASQHAPSPGLGR